jgi:hypothetical protein
MDAAAPLLEMTDNLSTINPFPSGIAGGLDNRLRNQGAIIRGITQPDATGQTDSPNIGRMGGWAFRSQGARVPLASLLRILLARSGGRVPLSALISMASTADA